MDKLTELARGAAEYLLRYLKDDEVKIKLVDGIVDDWLPYLRRAYDAGQQSGEDEIQPCQYISKGITYENTGHLNHDGKFILRPVEPVEKPKPEKFSIGDRVTIRGGALVGQDMKQIRWKNTDEIFTIVDKVYNEMRYELMADGYGEPDSYGNGCLYSNESDITLFKSFEFEEPQNMSGTDMRINLEIREREIAAKDEEIAALREENEKLKERISKYTESLWGLYDYQI